jgi:transcriptional regulator with XRE-family HTH domain
VEDRLVAWINKELEKRDWSHRKLAREAGVSHTHISNVLSGERNVTFDFCASIAKALGKLPEDLFRMAGLLPPLPEPEDELLSQVTDAFNRLPPDKRREVLDFALWQLRRNGEE